MKHSGMRAMVRHNLSMEEDKKEFEEDIRRINFFHYPLVKRVNFS